MNSNETKSALHTETPTSYATLGYSLGIEPSKAIFVASLLIGVACYYLRSRTESSGSKRDTIWDIFSTIIFVVSLSFGASTWLELTTLGPSVVSDFTQDYAAALALRHGVPIFGKAFESFAAQQFQVSIFEPGIRNFHPPFNAVLFLPLSYVPYPRAFIIWNAVSVLCYVTLVYLLLSSYRIATSRVLLLSSLLLLWVPFTSNIALGQTSIVLALFICGGFFLLEYYGKE